MDNGDAKIFAAELVKKLGPPEAWKHSNREALDAILRHDDDETTYWAAVQRHMCRAAPRPGAGTPQIYDSAWAEFADGSQTMEQARDAAMAKSIEFEGDVFKQVYWLRLADAIHEYCISPRLFWGRLPGLTPRGSFY